MVNPWILGGILLASALIVGAAYVFYVKDTPKKKDRSE